MSSSLKAFSALSCSDASTEAVAFGGDVGIVEAMALSAVLLATPNARKDLEMKSAVHLATPVTASCWYCTGYGRFTFQPACVFLVGYKQRTDV